MSALSMILVVALSFAVGYNSTGVYTEAAAGTPAIAAAAETAGAAVRLEGPGFDTPEAAVICYMEGLKNLDFGQMLSAFAWETQASHYSFDAYYQRIKAYSPATKPRMPAVNDFMVEANMYELRSAQIDLIYRSLETYILGSDAPQGMTIVLKEQADIDAFMGKFDNGRLEKLSRLSSIRFVSPDTVTGNKFSMEKNQQNFMRQTAVYGAEKVVNVVGIASVGDETLYCFPTVARYGGRWYLVSVSSMTANILGIGMDCQAFICGRGSLNSLNK